MVNMTEIRVAKSAGFCFGVDRAVAMVYDLVKTHPTVKTLGPIVHNPQVVGDLAAKGVEIITEDAAFGTADTVVIRAHGVSQSVYDKLQQQGAHFVDATCPFVAKIHKIVQQKSEEGLPIIIAGDPDHPEVLGIRGHVNGESYVIQNAKDLQKSLDSLHENGKNDVVLVAQTTYHTKFLEECEETAKKHCTNVIFFDTICNATNDRQTEAISIAKDSDLMIVIGGRESSNTQKLKDVCEPFTTTYLIETKEELSSVPITGRKVIGVTAGASTPAHIIKEVLETMSELLNNMQEDQSFAELFEQSLETEKLYTGKRVKGIVTTVAPNEIHVDIGAKQAGIVVADELCETSDQKTSDMVQKGDEIELVVLKVNDQEGVVMLSKKRCDAQAGFDILKKAFEAEEVLTGTVTNVVKGGILVLCNHTKVFIPASQVSDKRIEDLNTMLKEEVSFKILEINEKRARALGSIRAVLTAARKEAEEAFWGTVEVGKTYSGEVKSLTSYGAFVDLGGVDGMIHVTELAWGKIKHPSEVVSVGDMVEVYVKDLDVEKRRISLGYKKESENPWNIFAQNYNVDDVVSVKIVSFTNYGAFATIVPGIDGLIHISQIANQRVDKIMDLLQIGQEVEAKIIDINHDSKRVSLSIRALLPEDAEMETEEVEMDVEEVADEA